MTDTAVAARIQTRGADRTTTPIAPTRFADLGISPRVVDALAKRGLTEAFPIQSLVMPDALAGRDILAKSRTGSGKTLAFAIPLVETLTPSDRAPTALILAPTRELASQVTEEFRAIADVRRLKVAAVYGGVGIGPQAKIARHSDIVIATPGRLLDLVARKLLRLDRVRKVVLDEADRMLDMGFLPDVRRILELLRPDRQTMLFSATLDGDIGRLAEAHTHDAVRHEITDDRPVVAEADSTGFLAVDHPAKFRTLVRELAADRGLTLVFVRTKRGADRIARNLKKEGFRAGALPATCRPQRERALGHFAAGRNDVLIATDVAARGLDLEHISHVIDSTRLPTTRRTSTAWGARPERAGPARASRRHAPDQGADVGRSTKELSLHGEFADSGIRTHTTNQAPRRNGNGGAPKRQQRPNSSNRGRRRR